MSVALVVPTCRDARLLDFITAWVPVKFWDTLIIVRDEPATWTAIDADLGPDAWIISRRDSAIRSYGFLQAWRLGCELTVTLDDDCLPVPGVDHLAGHLAALDATPVWQSTIPGMRLRGLPYGNLGTLPNVVANVGLWRGVPDLDGRTTLASGCPTDFVPPDGSRILPGGTYAPLCGMNLAFRREFLPLAYFGLQGEGWPYRRFDDVWMGVIAKRICDFLGWSIAVGAPHIHHSRASDPHANAIAEAPGIDLNERFWRVVDAIPLTGSTAPECYREIAFGFRRNDDGYLRTLGRAMIIWSDLLTG